MTADTPSAEMTACRLCQERISVKAELCRHCHSYQDWRRHLNFSGTVLALLVALVSVLGWMLPAVATALRPSHSRITLSNPVVRGEAIYLIATNVGSQPGVIKRGLLRSPYIDLGADLLMIHPADALIPPGAKQIGLKVHLQLSTMDAHLGLLKAVADSSRRNSQRLAGHVVVWSQGSNGQDAEARLAISYQDIATLLEAHASRCKNSAAPPTMENGCRGIRELEADNRRFSQQIQESLTKAADQSSK
ncbi:hypothetical protein [Sphingosinicella sp.]|uniref:hypothetical protein n=1 Tax=Sphingosinicella sp. TaxID=1917971 RepID=UPI0035AE185D